MTATNPNTVELLALINDWTRSLIEHPTFRLLIRSKIGSALDWEDDWKSTGDRVTEVVLPEPLAAQHDAVMRFYYLHTAAERLKTVEFYFRRYPFNDLPVNRHEHLENVCAMYFSYFYVFQERLRVYLNALNKASAPAGIEVGKTLKGYQNRFKLELRERHGGTHFETFEDPTIYAVMLRGLRESDRPSDKRAEATYTYRKASREWAGHARRGAMRIEAFLDAIACASLDVATFLKTPPTLSSEDLKLK